MLIESIAIGLLFGFTLFEVTGLVAGGLVSPGYFAVYWERPWIIAAALGLAALTMLLVRAISLVTLLYGRRRFLVTVLTGFFLQWTLGAAVIGTEIAQGRIDSIGYIIPGLVAHEMDRQGFGITVLMLLLLTAATRLALHLLGMLGPI